MRKPLYRIVKSDILGRSMNRRLTPHESRVIFRCNSALKAANANRATN